MSRARVRSLLRRVAELERKRPLDPRKIHAHFQALRAGAEVDDSREAAFARDTTEVLEQMRAATYPPRPTPREAVMAQRLADFIDEARASDIAEGEELPV